MPLLGRREKRELEELIRARLDAQWDAHGPEGLVAPGVCLAIDARGAAVVAALTGEELASVEIRSLFTAVCHLSAEGSGILPRDSVPLLASEATTALAAQVNRIAPG